MLEMNGQSISATELIAKFEKHPNGSGLKKIHEQIKRNPLFSINSAVKKILADGSTEYVNKYRKSDSKGTDVLLRFTFWDNFGLKEGEFEQQTEIRYYKSKSPRTTNGITKMIYTPRAIDLAGDFFKSEKDEELAVYMLLNPNCGTSPLHDPESAAKYNYKDKVKDASKTLEKYDVYTRVANLLAAMDDEDLPFIARGLGIQNVKDMTAIEIKAAVTGYAYEKKEEFLEKYNNSFSIEFEGRIIYGLDNDLFTSKVISGVHSFFWGKKSPNNGGLIFQSDRNSSNPISEFINHIKMNRESFYEILMSGSKSILADQGLEEFLKLKDKPELAADLIKPKKQEIYLSSVVDPASAKEYVSSKHPAGRSGSPANMKKFLEAVQSGGLTEENVDEYLQEEVFPKG